MWRRATRRHQARCCADCGMTMRELNAPPRSSGSFPVQKARHRRLMVEEAMALVGGVNIVEVSADLTLPGSLRPRKPF